MQIVSIVLVASTILMSSYIAVPTKVVSAQSSKGGTGSVPIDTLFNWHNIQLQSKNFILDSLAWNVAKMTLQQLTTSIVNWINNGFEGSPAFLDNPEAFFLDLGDEITGNFIANVGPLQNLCSPWNIDLRLSLALGQTRSMSERYRCTLETIIGNAQNASINGYSIEGFTSGDFSQGGWPAFIAMTSEPQNNPYGSYLQAKSDLEAQIFGKKQDVNNDLNRGQGFLSYSDCQTISENDLMYDYGIQKSELEKLNLEGSIQSDGTSGYENGSWSQSTINRKTDSKTGKAVYQRCQVTTPGSVINAGLNKSLGSSIDQLNLADSINEITSALFAQLISQVFTQGLGGTTRRTGGRTQSYIDQLNAQSRGAGAYSNSAQNIQSGYATYLNKAQEVAEIYRQATAAFDIASDNLSLAQGCFQDITTTESARASAKGEAQRNADEIASILINQLAPTALIYTEKHRAAQTTVDTISARVRSAQNISDTQTAQEATNQYQEFIATQIPIIQQGRENGTADLATAQEQAAKFNKSAEEYMSSCRSLKSSAQNSR